MATIRQCADCGTNVPDDVPDGSCPVCVLQGALALSDNGSEAVVAEKPGDWIGRYKLLEKIGEGGCGVVYMAEQAQPIRRRVALKVVKLGMDTKQVIARFEAERQALALMDHPNIAKVFDGGATGSAESQISNLKSQIRGGRPFFVMELVRGLRITDYCDQHNLATAERLDLFIEVCHAVQHAHQKGIIHRDLKPSNVLVTVHEGVPVPKVIDFGIAKATQQPLTDKTLFTACHQFIGTAAYMSPEQAEMSGLDVDTRSDIYSLGVLLYELLTGTTPFDARELSKAGFDEMRRIIRETEPEKPSTRLTQELLKTEGGKGEREKRSSAASGSEPSSPPFSSAPFPTDQPGPLRVDDHRPHQLKQLISLLRGDLDWIVMKCLEKDRQRRYETASDLAQDVERHLQHEPVTAAAPGAFYRMRKLVRRHRVGLAMATGSVLLLMAGVVASSWQAVRATRAERQQSRLWGEAEKARQEAEAQKRRVEEALQDAEAQRNRAEISLAEVEREKAEKEKALQDSQEQRGQAMAALAVAQREKARAEEERARAETQELETRRQKAVADEQRSAAERQKALAETASQNASQQWNRAEAALEELRDQQAQLFDLGERQRPIGRVDVLRTVTEKVLAHYKSPPEDNESDESLARRFRALKNLGDVWVLQGDSAKAAEAYRTSLEMAEKVSARDLGRTNWLAERCLCHQRLGEIWEARGDSLRALEEFEKSLHLAQRLAEHAPLNTPGQAYALASYIKLGDVLWAQADKSRALAAYQTALRTALNLVQETPHNAQWQMSLSASYAKVGALLLVEAGAEKALAPCRTGLRIARQFAEKDPDNTAWQSVLAASCDGMGDVFLAGGDAAKALENYQESLRIRQRLAGSDPDNTTWQRDLLRSYSRIGRALSYESKKSKTLEAMLSGLKGVGAFLKAPLDVVQRPFSPDNRSAQLLERFDERVKEAQQLADKDPGNAQWQEDLAKSRSLMGDMLLLAGEKKNALREYREALAIRRQLVRADGQATELQYWLALSHANVAVALWRLSKHDEALSEARKTLGIFGPLMSRWPGNFVLREGRHLGERNLSDMGQLSPDQRDDLAAAFERGFVTAKNLAQKELTNPSRQEEWANYCAEMAVLRLFHGDTAEAADHAQNAVAIWQRLSSAASTNLHYKALLARAWVTLGALQILTGQSQAAIQSARQGLALDKTMIEFRALLALGFLCDGQYESGRLILVENKDINVSPKQTFPAAIVHDLRRLRDSGLALPDMEKIEEFLAFGRQSRPFAQQRTALTPSPGGEGRGEGGRSN